MNIDQIMLLRVAVGYLGEQASPPWWPSKFFDRTSESFLTPIYPRTHVLARCEGVTAAAAIVHDERIGVGQVYHLFRLPMDLEQTIHQRLQGDAAALVTRLTATPEAAREYLAECAGRSRQESDGPVRVGGSSTLTARGTWSSTAACYLSGFERGQEVFPFFSDQP